MPDRHTQVTAAILIIGDEILSGKTQESNLAYLSKALNTVGVQVAECRIVADVEADIIDAVNACRSRYDYVFTTGGIGPTHDDITADSIAAAFDVDLELHSEAVKRLKIHSDQKNIELNEARLRMARIPKGASLIDNPVSSAPGFLIDNVFVLAGPPAIVRGMFESLSPQLKGGLPVESETISVTLHEGILARPLRELQDEYETVSIGSYPKYERQRYVTSIVCRSQDKVLLREAFEKLTATVLALGAEIVE